MFKASQDYTVNESVLKRKRMSACGRGGELKFKKKLNFHVLDQS